MSVKEVEKLKHDNDVTWHSDVVRHKMAAVATFVTSDLFLEGLIWNIHGGLLWIKFISMGTLVCQLHSDVLNYPHISTRKLHFLEAGWC